VWSRQFGRVQAAQLASHIRYKASRSRCGHIHDQPVVGAHGNQDNDDLREDKHRLHAVGG
jgi:hypothetical protein